MNTTTRGMIAALSFLGAMMPAMSAVAGEQVKTVQVLKVQSDDGDPVTLRFEGDTGFSDLADGETRTMTTADGEAVTVTRNTDQLSILTSSGKTVELPVMHGANARLHGEHHEQRKIKIMHQAGDDSSQILIVSPGGLSDQEQTTIRQAIESAGIDKEILFLGGETNANIDVDIEIDE